MKGRGWLAGYGIVAAVHLAAIAAGWDTVRFVTKPMLMVILVSWFMIVTAGSASLRTWIISALIFSWLGDVFLMIQGGSGFIAGLSSFLLAHACYVIFFLLVRRRSGVPRKWNGYILAAVVIYVASFNYYLLPALDFALKVPVLVYSIIIGTMFIAVFHASPRNNIWHNLAITGALLFIISDSILAVNTFLEPFGAADLLIMTTYILAQAFLASGAAIWLRTAHKS
ncbi:lysoplasmalogenase [Flavihumibacter solisilvae]|uniref:lysoplasmalogenase n=1 Tax=Flavihumibacter solisilvae TaxID=1349421 RepID=UPI00068ACF23|nr:lysoplasmalogenase [Flavihumibacter solisilvae]